MKKTFLLTVIFLLAACTYQQSQNNIFSSENSSLPNIISSNSSAFDIYQKTISYVTVKTENYSDPYVNVSRNQFYRNYQPAEDYLDAYYRTQHGFISGEIPSKIASTPSTSVKKYKNDDGQYYFISNVTYLINEQGQKVGYQINTFNGENKYIYEDGGYITLDEVAAYLYAFGDVPPNNDYEKDEKYLAEAEWGEYGRVNNSSYSNSGLMEGDVILPYDKRNCYFETDFGTETYHNGGNNNRGVYRFVYMNDLESDIFSRHVFFTNDHYDSFYEYLNYEDAFGERFGLGTRYDEYVETEMIRKEALI